MVKYETAKVQVSAHQKKKMALAVHNGAQFSLKLSHGQLTGPDELHLTLRQKTKLMKHKAMHKGIVLKFSNRQMKYMAKHGGFIAPLIASLVGSLLPGLISTGVDTIKNKIAGKGMPHDISIRGSGLDPIGQLVAKNAVINANNERMLRGLPPVAMPNIAGYGQKKSKEGGFIGPLIAGLLSGAAGSLLSGAVTSGVREKAGLNKGSGLKQLGTGLTQLGAGIEMPFKKKKEMGKKSVGYGLRKKVLREQAYQDSQGLRVL